MEGLFQKGKEFMRAPVEVRKGKVMRDSFPAGWGFVTASENPADLDLHQSVRSGGAAPATARPADSESGS